MRLLYVAVPAMTALLSVALTATPAYARPVVVELFTSEACSSCPPADALLGQLKSDSSILPLSFHVSYWNGPAWTDQYSLTAATDRQTWYAGLQGDPDVYTPEAVVDGQKTMVGSDREKVTDAIANAKSTQAPVVPVSVSGGTMVTVRVGDGAGNGTIWLFGYDTQHVAKIGGGENGGATLTETNVVRSIASLGTWNGVRMGYTIPKPAGEHMAVILQAPDGTILGAAAD